MATTTTSTPSPFDNAITNTPMPQLSKEAIIWIAVISAIVLACMTAVAFIMARGLCCHRRRSSSTKEGTTVLHSPLYPDQRNSFVAWKKWEGQTQISTLPNSSSSSSSSHATFGSRPYMDASSREKAAKARETGIVVPMQSFDFRAPLCGGSAGMTTVKKFGRLSVPLIVESDQGVLPAAGTAALLNLQQQQQQQQQRLQKGSRYYSGWPRIERNSWRRSSVIGRAM